MRGRFLIAFLGFALAIAPSPSTGAEDLEDIAYVKDRIPKILEFEQTGTKIPWRNPETGNGGIVMVERTYFTDPKTPCRDFILTLDAGEAAPLTAQGTGCRTGQGKWQLSDEPELSSLSAIRRGWALPEGNASAETLNDNRDSDGSAYRDSSSERRRSDVASPGRGSDEEIKAAAIETLPDLESEKRPVCAGLSGDGSPVEAKDLDIVFLVDTTSSMQSELGDIQADVMSTVRLLQRMAVSLNVGIVAFRDRADTYETRAFQLTPMTEGNLRRLANFVEGLEAKGGGDVPESINEALVVAEAMAWRPMALGQIIVISDAPAQKEAEFLAFDTARNFHAGAASASMQRRVSAVYTGSTNRLSSREFHQRLVESGGGCFSSHQSTLIENVLISVL